MLLVIVKVILSLLGAYLLGCLVLIAMFLIKVYLDVKEPR